ncbi:MAG: TlpA family protein disulfide reductase [Pyrinomonadaceae bacterium]
MEHSRIRTYLEVATNAVVLLVAVLILSAFAVSHFSRPATNRTVSDGLQRGQQIPSLGGIDYSSSPHTLLIAMSTQCGHCTASIPFYNQLAGLKSNGKAQLRIVTAFSNPDENVRQYVEQHQLKLEAKNSVDFRQLKIAGTPTMILVDPSGRVVDFWVGELSSEDQQRVVQSLTSLS